MTANVVSLSLTVAGTAADLSPLGEYFRNVTFFDQEKMEMGGLFKNLLTADVATAQTILAEGGMRIFNGVPFFRPAPLSASADQTGKLCDFPIESGAVISDHKVREPRRFSCLLAMPNALAGQVIDQLNLYYHESKKVVIQAPTGIYSNMILEAMPVNMTPEDVSRPKFELKFREVLIVEPNYDPGISPENVTDGDVRKTSVITDALTSTLGGVLNYLGSW